MTDQNKLWPFDRYDPDQSLEERVKYLEHRLREAIVQERWHDGWLDELSTSAHVIASSILVDHPGRDDVSKTLSSYWRWTMWMDSQADVPEMIQLLLQGMVGMAFDIARNE